MKTSAGKDSGTEEYIFSTGGMQIVADKSVWTFLKKMEVDLSHDPAIPPLNTYPEDSIYYYRILISVHWCSVHNSQEIETAYMSINW